MGSSAAGSPASYGETAKRLAGRGLLAAGTAAAAGARLVAKGVSALTAESGDKEPVRSLQFAQLEWGGRAVPVLLVGLATGFQVGRRRAAAA